MEPAGAGVRGMGLRLEIRPYAFALRQPLHTAAAVLHQRCGWLLRLEASDGRLGWGEVAPLLPQDHRHCAVWLEARRAPWSAAVAEAELEACLVTAPPPLAFALGAALAELEGLVAPGAWLPPPAPARLLPAGDRMPEAVMSLLRSLGDGTAVTLKWKVGVGDATQELQLLERLLAVLPPQARLRLDANGSWTLPTALRWVDVLRGDPRLEWLEQPLASGDWAGHQQLLRQVPVALDEGLRDQPHWRRVWAGWQVRRPVLEGDPRPLLHQLQRGVPNLMLSTAFETGIGSRWLGHLAGLQCQGPTPAAPGLAPGWRPEGPLFSHDPHQVWAAADQP